jgi:threonylcarbamoyladenosine tRNA methylthiotransferase MtaB
VTAEEGWSSPARVALQTVGCKLNQAETESLVRSLHRAGYRVVAPDQAADVYILNTCTVTHVADRKCRNLLRQARRRDPRALIVATGCYAERNPKALESLEDVGLIVGNRDKAKLARIIGSKVNGHGSHRPASPARRQGLRTRAMVKIHEGCSQSCSFCIVPSVRGMERSRPVDDIVADVGAGVAEGCKEVILTGTRIGRYRHDRDLRGLVERILQETAVPRLRLSSLEPGDLTGDFLGLWENGRLCPHIHMPLQSGSDQVLDRMGRSYSTDDYLRAATVARDAISNLALTTDVMVGFPGESDNEFSDSHTFCERVGFADMHVFPYSPRPGTSAALMADSVCDGEKKRRAQAMLDLARRSARRFREKFLGQVMSVLWEEQKEAVSLGLTDNYLRVYLPNSDLEANHIQPARMIALQNGGLRGELLAQGSEF